MQVEFYQAFAARDIEKVKQFLNDGQINYQYCIWFACYHNSIEIVSHLLASNINLTVDDLTWATILAINYDRGEIAKLLFTDKRINPKGEDGIRFDSEDLDIVVFDDFVCLVRNEDIDSIKDNTLREKYLLWLYRIGGEKHSQAVENLK